MLRILLIIGVVVVAGALIAEVNGWINGTRSVSRRQKVLRFAAGIILITAMLMVIVGDRWLEPYGPFVIMIYWMTCFVLAVALVAVTLLDIREVGITYGEARKRIYRDLAKPSEKEEDDSDDER